MSIKIRNTAAWAIYAYLSAERDGQKVSRQEIFDRFDDLGLMRYTLAMEHLKFMGLVRIDVCRNARGQITSKSIIATDGSGHNKVTPKYGEPIVLETPTMEEPIVLQSNTSVDEKPKADKAFKRPILDEVIEHCREKNYLFDPNTFFDHYQANGWKIGKASMKCWTSAAANWNRRESGNANTRQGYGKVSDTRRLSAGERVRQRAEKKLGKPWDEIVSDVERDEQRLRGGVH